MRHAEHGSQRWLVIALIVMGVVSRLVPHPPNVTPLMAIALFGGTYLAKRWAILLPLTIVILSDAILGWHTTMPFGWAAFAVTGMIAWWVRRQPNVTRIATAALAGSVLFFLITNLGVWLVGGLYPPTAAGFQRCYIAALPFFRNSLLGDVVYTGALFGGFALASRSLRAQRA